MNYLKSYHVFLSQKWLRFLLYLVFPSLLLLFAGFLGKNLLYADREANKALFSAFLCVLCDSLAGIEIFADLLIFGGIAARDTNKLEYLKTSSRGMPLLKKALITDGIRRFLSIALIAGVGSRLFIPSYSLLDSLTVVTTICFYTELGLIITRHFPNKMVLTISLSMITALMPPTIVLLQKARGGAGLLFSSLSAIIVLFLGRWLILKKARNSYYDYGTETSL